MWFARRIAALARSGRAWNAILVNALGGIASLAISVAIARESDAFALGEFSVAYAAWLFGTGLIRAAIVEPLAAKLPSREEVRASGRRTSLFALIASIIVVAIGASIGNMFLVIVGIALHGSTLYDTTKYISSALSETRLSRIQELGRSAICVVAAVVVFFDLCTSEVGFAIWCGGTAVAGYLTASVGMRLQLRPGWSSPVRATHTVSFGGDYILGSGSANVTTFLLAAVASPIITGVLRGANIMLGPANLIVATLRSLLIPYLARDQRASPTGALQRSLGIAAISVVLTSPLTVGVLLLPDSVGEFVLAENWALIKPVLPFLAIELLLTVSATVPFAAHRVMLAGRRTIIVRSVTSVARVATVVLCGVNGGALGASIAMSAMAALSGVVWWISYVTLVRSAR